LREIGHLINSNYKDSTTSSFGSNSVNAYQQFGLKYSDFTDANINIIKSSLFRSRPVQMQGQHWGVGGHGWVADGYRDIEIWRTKYARLYDDGEFVEQWTRKISESHVLHINWGWDGICNGYFTFDTYNTAQAEEYDTDNNFVEYDFWAQVKMIANIRVEGPSFPPIPL
jgi:hypothetical protein